VTFDQFDHDNEPQPEWVCPCPECNGWTPGPPEGIDCSYCGGRGWEVVAVSDPADPDGEPLPEQRLCASCGGTGEVYSVRDEGAWQEPPPEDLVESSWRWAGFS
jgi:hypothetical protein